MNFYIKTAMAAYFNLTVKTISHAMSRGQGLVIIPASENILVIRGADSKRKL
ncbi:MAG: hypothetical protein H0U49_07320 [Parachlamydiaceae bacterium]|nr:hypothetical protein [Parachlamydiaceae bacterium]